MHVENIINYKNFDRHGYNQRYYKTTRTFFYSGYYINSINYGYYKFCNINSSYTYKHYYAK